MASGSGLGRIRVWGRVRFRVGYLELGLGLGSDFRVATPTLTQTLILPKPNSNLRGLVRHTKILHGPSHFRSLFDFVHIEKVLENHYLFQ